MFFTFVIDPTFKLVAAIVLLKTLKFKAN